MSSNNVNIVGRIHHVVDSKKFRPPNKKRPRSLDADTDSKSCARGFLFVSQEEGDLSAVYGSVFHLVIPLTIVKTVCWAAATGNLVQLTRYTLIRYVDGLGEVVFDSRSRNDGDEFCECGEQSSLGDTSYNVQSNIMVAEIHSGGLEVTSHHALDTTTKHQMEGPILTLDMLSTTEQSASRTKHTSSKNLINVTASVDAISPIFIHDTDRSFALIEFYQPDTHPTRCAVAVLRGESALSMHPAIYPGQSLTLTGVVSRSWKVSEGFRQSYRNINESSMDSVTSINFFERLYQRTPDRVILVEDFNGIQFDDEASDESLLPSTVESLKSIRGVVVSVHYHRYEEARGNSTQDIIHFVCLKCFTQQCTLDNNEENNESIYDSDGNESDLWPKIVRINLLKYSFARHILFGLQPGGESIFVVWNMTYHRYMTNIY
jgi:hypothetical protein